MNIYDIAKKAGVSTATVSRYINKSGYVGKKTAATIQEIIDKSGFAPSVLAKNLSTGDSLKLIGLVCYDINDLYYAKCASILEKRLKSAGYEIILTCTGKNSDEKQADVDALLKKNVDALIFIGAVFMDISEKIVSDASKICPCFIINANLRGHNIYSAYCDDFAAVADTVRRLETAGYKNPVYVCNNETHGTRIKIDGFLSVISDTNCVYKFTEDFDENVADFIKLFGSVHPDSVICSSDVVAAAALKAAASLNIAVPKTLAVVGHNNSFLTKVTAPTLTSIDNGVEELSRITADNIIKLFNNETVKKEIKIPHALKRRESF